ncbi:MAG: nuclear transport factor 2 family protein [Burkholderiales bacterium]
MTQETNLQKLDRFGRSAAFAADPTEGLKQQQALLHPDFTIVEADSLPYGGTYRGPEGWATLIANVKKAWNPVRVTPQWTIGEPNGDKFGKMYRISGKSALTGKAFDMQVFELWEFKDGLIHSSTPYYFDTKALHDIHKV